MLIITGKLYVAIEERQKWIDAHYEIVKRARSMPGCVDLYLVADPVEAGRVNLFEQWQSEDDLQAWRRVADPPPRPPTLGGSVEKHQLGRSGPPF
jgi:quinol monooxygenase YgiN